MRGAGVALLWLASLTLPTAAAGPRGAGASVRRPPLRLRGGVRRVVRTPGAAAPASAGPARHPAPQAHSRVPDQGSVWGGRVHKARGDPSTTRPGQSDGSPGSRAAQVPRHLQGSVASRRQGRGDGPGHGRHNARGRGRGDEGRVTHARHGGRGMAQVVDAGEEESEEDINAIPKTLAGTTQSMHSLARSKGRCRLVLLE